MTPALFDAAQQVASRFTTAGISAAVVALKESGLLAAHVPARLGGPELALSEIAEITRILAIADGSLAQIPQSHFTFSCWLFMGDHPDQEELWAKRLLGGALIANAQAEFEPLTLQDGRLNGVKKWCTGSTWADYLAVTVRSDDLGVFIPADARGVRIIDDWRGLGQQGTGSGTIKFEQVAVDLTYSRAHALALPAYGAFAYCY
ncbi:hypothetical protein SFC07_11620 [Corynebacterium callunae]|uniref:acyl-CoA dehydrogenase family protein n=1 Tax=Corynebacterium callunae TaxID=1721 RepID=UPI0039826F86